MKLSKSVMFGAAACLLSTSASAQAAGDLLALSQYNYSFSTARSAALGGAFTSLGADLSSMSINPAGLGMYMSSDFGISPSLTWNNMQSTYLGTKSDYSRTRFTLGNLGMAFNLYQGSGTLTSFTLGVGYSKLADFNTTSAAYGQGIDKSITDVLAEYMNGVPLSSLGHPDNDPYQPFRRADVGLWGGILAYQTGILDPMSDAQDNKQYTVANNLATGSRINPSMRNVNKGSIDEYSISGGFNIQNILYLGFTIGIQDILYRNDNYYAETYDNNPLPLNGMNYIRSLHLDGTGVNFKFGAVVRPVENLRIGAPFISSSPRGWRVCSRSFSTAWRCSAGSTILSTACSIFLPWCILFPWRCCLCSSPARGLKNAAGREKGGANDAGQQTTPGK